MPTSNGARTSINLMVFMINAFLCLFAKPLTPPPPFPSFMPATMSVLQAIRVASISGDLDHSLYTRPVRVCPLLMTPRRPHRNQVRRQTPTRSPRRRCPGTNPQCLALSASSQWSGWQWPASPWPMASQPKRKRGFYRVVASVPFCDRLSPAHGAIGQTTEGVV